jgi:butyryl-CoA dehydrogenase
LQAKAGDADFYQAKITTARFFADYFLSQADSYRAAIVEGSASILALPEEQF